MAKTEKTLKVKKARVHTRNQALRLLTAGSDPKQFLSHASPHVKRRCWQLMGRPLPTDINEQNKFLSTLQGTETPKDPATLEGFYLLLRQRILHEVPFKEPAPETVILEPVGTPTEETINV